MKITIKVTAIITIIALIGLSFTACNPGNEGGNGNSIPASFRFRNQQPPANLNIQSSREIMGGTTEDTASLGSGSALHTYYSITLGGAGKIAGTYTPAEFKVYEPRVGGKY